MSRERPGPLFKRWKLEVIRKWDFAAGGDMQTRRPMRPQPAAQTRGLISSDDGALWVEDCLERAGESYRGYSGDDHRPPHGVLGTSWYLKETLHREGTLAYFDDGRFVLNRITGMPMEWGEWQRDKQSAMFMPRAAARDFVTVLAVRAERLQDIIEADAIAEGWPRHRELFPAMNTASKVRLWFRKLWDSINAAPKLAKHNPYTLEPERCYVSYPWEDIRETRNYRGVTWYVVGNAWVWCYTVSGYTRDPGRKMPC